MEYPEKTNPGKESVLRSTADQTPIGAKHEIISLSKDNETAEPGCHVGEKLKDYSTEFQRQVLWLMTYDYEFLHQVAHVLKPEHFDERFASLCAECLLNTGKREDIPVGTVKEERLKLLKQGKIDEREVYELRVFLLDLEDLSDEQVDHIRREWRNFAASKDLKNEQSPEGHPNAIDGTHRVNPHSTTIEDEQTQTVSDIDAADQLLQEMKEAAGSIPEQNGPLSASQEDDDPDLKSYLEAKERVESYKRDTDSAIKDGKLNPQEAYAHLKGWLALFEEEYHAEIQEERYHTVKPWERDYFLKDDLVQKTIKGTRLVDVCKCLEKHTRIPDAETRDLVERAGGVAWSDSTPTKADIKNGRRHMDMIVDATVEHMAQELGMHERLFRMYLQALIKLGCLAKMPKRVSDNGKNNWRVLYKYGQWDWIYSQKDKKNYYRRLRLFNGKTAKNLRAFKLR